MVLVVIVYTCAAVARVVTMRWSQRVINFIYTIVTELSGAMKLFIQQQQPTQHTHTTTRLPLLDYDDGLLVELSSRC